MTADDVAQVATCQVDCATYKVEPP